MAQSISSSFLAQLRRDAKRLGHLEHITHAQALDRIALERGHANWSLLVKHATKVPAAVGTASSPTSGSTSVAASEAASTSLTGADTAPVALHALLGIPRMDATRDERFIIRDIVVRYARIVEQDIEVDRLSTLMDLEACHCNGCPLDLVGLRDGARDEDLVHDVAGIGRYLDRETGVLTQMFTPRYALQNHRPRV